MHFELPFNWFDILLVGVLAFGVHTGRKHGLSVELIGTLKWLVIVVICGSVYEPVGTFISQVSVFSLFASYLMAYIGVALFILVAFIYLKRALGGKLVGSDAFGKSEFYLGMLAGMVQFACILFASIALLNARYYNSAEISAAQKYQTEVYGSNFFPSLYEVQDQVFRKSLTGPFFREQLGFLLIKPTAPHGKELKQREFATP